MFLLCIIISPVVFDSQAQISDATCAVLFNEDVFAFQVSVSDGRFALCAIDLCVEVTQAAGDRVCQSQQSLCVQGGVFQIVIERSVLMVVCDEEKLSECSCAFNICSYEAWRKIERQNKIRTDRKNIK